MLTKLQKELIDKVKVPIRYEDGDHLGYITHPPKVYINISKRAKKYTSVHDAVLIHEVGHAYYRHIFIPINDEFAEVISVATRLGITISRSPDFLHWVSNVSQDMQINSTLWTDDQISTMRKLGCMFPDLVGAKNGLDWKEYIEPVLLNMTKLISGNLVEDLTEGDCESAGIEADGEDNSGDSNEGSNESGESSEASESTSGDGEGSIPGDPVECPIDNDSEYKEGEDHGKVQESAPGQGNGGGKGTIDQTLDKEFTIDELDDLLSNLFEDKTYRSIYVDSMKHQIRNDRPSAGGLIHTSYKRKFHKVNMPKKYWIIIDVSGSMPTSLVKKLVSSLYHFKDRFDKASKLVLYSDHLHCITSINDKITNYSTGCGNALFNAIKMGIDKKFENILLISDFFDYDDDMYRVCSRYKASYELINILSYGKFEEVDCSMPKSLPLFKRYKLRVNI